MNIIETKGLYYSYDSEKDALIDVDIKIKKGEVTAILGGNGAGKSTLFLNLNGVLTPSSGEVFLNSQLVSYNSKGTKALRSHIGIVFQDPNDQLFSASVRSDIAFGAINQGLSEKEAAPLVEEVARQAGVLEFIDRPTHALSYGQKKRVAIAGVLIMKPEVIILDEPTAGLDPMGVSELFTLLEKVREETGVTIIISTHDIDIVPLYCSYAYVLEHGKVILEGTPKEIFANTEKMRASSLRIPRIAHLMEILNHKDHINVDITASTISQARATIKELLRE